MGGDGGSTVSRDIIIGKAQKRGLVQDIRLTNHGKYTNCALSGMPLQKPLVACELGMIYNKEAIVTFLLEVASMAKLVSECATASATAINNNNAVNNVKLTETQKIQQIVLEDKQMQFSHITKLSDLINCTVMMKRDNEGKGGDGKLASGAVGDGDGEEKNAINHVNIRNDGIGSTQDNTNYIICPITMLPADGALQFIVMRHCGCVMSEKGVEQINGKEQRITDEGGNSIRACCLCLKPYPERYQDGFVPLAKESDRKNDEKNDGEDKKMIEIGKKVVKKKKNQAAIDAELLRSFPLQYGEEAFIRLVPVEKDEKILEAIMLAKRTHLGKALPQDIKATIKRQRIQAIENNSDLQRMVQLEPVGLVSGSGKK